MISPRLPLIAVACACFAAACRAPQNPTAVPAPGYDALFSRPEGWTGGDGAASVPLGDGRILWLFGDTWIGSVRAGRRVAAAMVANTVAIQSGADLSTAGLEFYAGSPRSKPSAFLAPSVGPGVFWPAAGIATKEGLFLVMSRIVKKEGADSVFGFRTAGRTLVRIRDAKGPPDRWSMTQGAFPWAHSAPSGDEMSFGDAFLNVDGMIYAYGLETKDKDRFLLVGRVPEEKFSDFTQWRFYRDGHWQPNFMKSERLADHLGAELSVSYSDALGRYLAVYTEDGLSRDIVVRVAPAPQGPWSAAKTVYRCPEMDWDKDYFCYAAKAHPELSRSKGGLLISYVVNSFDFGKMAGDARICRPRFVRLDLSAAGL